MQISEDVIERIKNENDIVDVISESVRLKRSGRNYMGLCPFHNEKSPSFSVSEPILRNSCKMKKKLLVK